MRRSSPADGRLRPRAHADPTASIGGQDRSGPTAWPRATGRARQDVAVRVTSLVLAAFLMVASAPLAWSCPTATGASAGKICCCPEQTAPDDEGPRAGRTCCCAIDQERGTEDRRPDPPTRRARDGGAETPAVVGRADEVGPGPIAAPSHRPPPRQAAPPTTLLRLHTLHLC